MPGADPCAREVLEPVGRQLALLAPAAQQQLAALSKTPRAIVLTAAAAPADLPPATIANLVMAQHSISVSGKATKAEIERHADLIAALRQQEAHADCEHGEQGQQQEAA